MNNTPEQDDTPIDRWVFGLEEIPAVDKDDSGEIRHVATRYSATVIRAPEGTPEVLRWAAEEFVAQCGPDYVVSALLLLWLKVEAGEGTMAGVESCSLERISTDRVGLRAHYEQWDDAEVPIMAARRMLIDMAEFLLTEARRPLPAWRIIPLGERDWTRKRQADPA